MSTPNPDTVPTSPPEQKLNSEIIPDQTPSTQVSQAPPIPTYQSPSLSSAVPQNAMETFPVSQKKPSFILPLVLSLIFLIVIAALGTGSYAVAYQKIKLPEKFQGLQIAITNFVQSLPFTPKTPEFLIGKALIAQDKVNKESYDLSVAIDSEGASLIPGMDSTIDLAAKGLIDYSDTKNIKFTVDGFLTKDFNFELSKPDHLLYFNIKKIPSLLLSFVGMQSEDFAEIIGQWYFYDTTPLSTEARAAMEEKSGDKEVFSDKFVKDTLDTYIDEKLLKAMKVTDDTIDNFPVYKIAITADAELIDHIGKLIDEADKKQNGARMDKLSADTKKLSEIVKHISWEVNIDKKDYYVRKVAVVTEIEVDEVQNYGSLFMGSAALAPQTTSANIAFAAKFSDFGKDINIQKPDEAKSWEEFTDTISEIVRSQYENISMVSPTRQLSLSRDAARKQNVTSLQSAAEYFRIDNNRYPETLSELKGKYLSQIPKDPQSEADYYYKVSENKLNYDLCTTLELPDDPTKDTCPDSRYNYHLVSP